VNATTTTAPARGSIDVRPATVVLFSDLLCPFAHVAIHRFVAARARARLDGRLHLDHRTFPLELFNGPHPRPGTDTEAVGLGQIEPAAGFRVWTAPDWTYPSTVLLAHEAVHAAKEQGPDASERLDRALRRAFWVDSRPISHRSTILDVAREADVDAAAIAAALDDGRARAAITADYAVAQSDAVAGSPHFFFADGTDAHNPGITVRWEGPWASGYPIVEKDDPGVWDELVHRSSLAA
jgi:predicted DsbA family dithiol-disulfide isomerase